MTEAPKAVAAFVQAIEGFKEIEDPEERTQAVSAVLHNWQPHLTRLRQIRQDSVNELRHAEQRTWPQIAEIISAGSGAPITPERAQQIGKGSTSTTRAKKKAEKDAAAGKVKPPKGRPGRPRKKPADGTGEK